MKLIKENYEEGYHENVLYREARVSQRNRARLELLSAEVPHGRLLEIGCGQGGFLRLAKERYDAHGMEISSTAVAAAQDEFGERVKQGNLEEDPLPGQAYEAIAVFNILEHLRRPGPAAAKLHNALKPNGVLIGSVPHNNGPVGSVITRIGNYFDRTHVSTFTPGGWRSVFHLAGFSRVRFFGEVTIGRNRCVYLHHPTWWLVSFNLMFICLK